MPNLLQTSAAWLAGQLKTHGGRSVAVVRGGLEVATLTGTVSQQVHDIVDDEGLLTQVTSFDWTFTAEDFGELTLRAGDQLVETLNGVTATYEALPLGDKPAVEPLDTSGVMLLVHTRRVGNA